MSQRNRLPIVTAAIVEQHDNSILIVCGSEDDERTRQWRFPRGDAKPGEAPETAMRRVAQADLGLVVEIVVGQPPISVEIDNRAVELRVFFCGVNAGELACRDGILGRWVPKGHLREYDFDSSSQPVVDWLLDADG